jgi:hypothetical protein
MSSGFLDKNFLSDDERYPLVSADPRIAIGTNADRALGTNPIEGHIWQNFSSRTFKELPSLGTMTVENPFDEGDPISFPIRLGGYYRTPSLINGWATAPFFENNMLGAYTGDPSVKGRMTAFGDAAEKLLLAREAPGQRNGQSYWKGFGAENTRHRDPHSGGHARGPSGKYQHLQGQCKYPKLQLS